MLFMFHKQTSSNHYHDHHDVGVSGTNYHNVCLGCKGNDGDCVGDQWSMVVWGCSVTFYGC